MQHCKYIKVIRYQQTMDVTRTTQNHWHVSNIKGWSLLHNEWPATPLFLSLWLLYLILSLFITYHSRFAASQHRHHTHDALPYNKCYRQRHHHQKYFMLWQTTTTRWWLSQSQEYDSLLCTQYPIYEIGGRKEACQKDQLDFDAIYLPSRCYTSESAIHFPQR